MTAPVCRVTNCDHPLTDAYICSHHAHQLERALGDIPATIHQLNLTLAKQTRYADRAERGSSEQPLPMGPLASAAASDLRHHLCNWVTIIAETRGLPLPAAAVYHPGGEPGMDTLARWMLAHVEWLRHHEHGHIAVEELTADMRQARRVIVVPANRTTFPVGPCPEYAPSSAGVTSGNLAPWPSQPDIHALHCLGEIRAYIPNDQDQPARLECTTCHTVWEPWQWLRAGRRILDRKATMKGTAA
jgi:hypothetical protein